MCPSHAPCNVHVAPCMLLPCRHIEIIPLSTGCLGACTYCKTKHARGQLGSYDLNAIVDRAAAAARDPLVRGLSAGDGHRFGEM